MESDESFKYSVLSSYPKCFSLISCLILSLAYVGSLYIWSSSDNRNHPSTIKKRFLSVFIIMLISPFYVRLFIFDKNLQNISIFELLGIRWHGLIQATLIPLFLTMILFSGSIFMLGFSELMNLSQYWSCLNDLKFIRNTIVAPLCEEFCYRACMLPLLLQAYDPWTAICICPLFFGTAHLHHMRERINCGMTVNTAVLMSFFELSYTTLFGAYSGYLFVKTWHLSSCFIVHSFCNLIGFPDINELMTYKQPKKLITVFVYIVGLILWAVLVPYLLDSQIYHNSLIWT